MRLWTLHPQYLDSQGLVALWREALLARTVLRGATRGYRHHPQLERFQAQSSLRAAIGSYLAEVLAESKRRGYRFDASKVGPARSDGQIVASDGQLQCEWSHLMAKLEARSPQLHVRWRDVARPESHPLFSIEAGGVADWERHHR